jgi:hypothetical protein
MIFLSFKLSMPNVGSWNGRWSGEGKMYVVTRSFPKKQEDEARKILDGKYYYYNFGDGWSAGVTVSQCDAKEAARIRRRSAGFCGYDWMINSIIKHGKIITSVEALKQQIEMRIEQ